MKEALLTFVSILVGVIQWMLGIVPLHVSAVPSEQVTYALIASTSPSAEKRASEEKPATTVSKKVVIQKPPVIELISTSIPAVPLSSGPVSTATPIGTPPIPDYATLVETAILAFTNRERAQNGLATLSADSELTTLARYHSKDMSINDYFSHEDKAECGSSCRANNAGYRWTTIGENIYMMSGYTHTAAEAAEMVVEGWMNSHGHRENMLRPAFTHAGIGVYVEEKSVYTTAVYAKPQ